MLYVSNRSGRPNCHAKGETRAARNGSGARGKFLGITSSSGGLYTTHRNSLTLCYILIIRVWGFTPNIFLFIHQQPSH